GRGCGPWVPIIAVGCRIECGCMTRLRPPYHTQHNQDSDQQTQPSCALHTPTLPKFFGEIRVRARGTPPHPLLPGIPRKDVCSGGSSYTKKGASRPSEDQKRVYLRLLSAIDVVFCCEDTL